MRMYNFMLIIQIHFFFYVRLHAKLADNDNLSLDFMLLLSNIYYLQVGF